MSGGGGGHGDDGGDGVSASATCRGTRSSCGRR